MINQNMNSGLPTDTTNTVPNIDRINTQVLDNLSERERQIILDVLKRDEEVRHRENARIV